MNFAELPEDWPTQRETMRRVGAHVVARAQANVTGNFALMALPGGFGTPQFGEDRQRVRIAGGSLFVERVSGNRNGEPAATTDVHMIAGSTIRSLCNAMGFEPDPAFSVGNDTPELGDPDDTLVIGSGTTAALGDWWGFGQRAMDIAIASFPDPQASVSRLWPEHFDVGTDLAVDPARKPGVRTNIGAAAGDEAHQEPYLYVGPWSSERGGPDEFWNQPFGATIGFGELDAAENPLATAAEFYLRGIAYLRM